ncbi:hypothetical protein ACXZB2_25715, partial [Escherichia coli]
VIGDGCQIMIDSNAKLRSIQMPFCIQSCPVIKTPSDIYYLHDINQIHEDKYAKILPIHQFIHQSPSGKHRYQIYRARGI